MGQRETGGGTQKPSSRNIGYLRRPQVPRAMGQKWVNLDIFSLFELKLPYTPQSTKHKAKAHRTCTCPPNARLRLSWPSALLWPRFASRPRLFAGLPRLCRCRCQWHRPRHGAGAGQHPSDRQKPVTSQQGQSLSLLRLRAEFIAVPGKPTAQQRPSMLCALAAVQ